MMRNYIDSRDPVVYWGEVIVLKLTVVALWFRQYLILIELSAVDPPVAHSLSSLQHPHPVNRGSSHLSPIFFFLFPLSRCFPLCFSCGYSSYRNQYRSFSTYYQWWPKYETDLTYINIFFFLVLLLLTCSTTTLKHCIFSPLFCICRV